MNKILIIGGSGYIGSSLKSFLIQKEYHVDNCDVEEGQNIVYNYNFNQLTRKILEKYDIIILLAGNSSVKSCEGDLKYSFKNNVDNFVELLSKVENDKLIIYASSSSVYGDSKYNFVKEEQLNFNPNNNYDLTKYFIDMINLNSNRENLVGLRFGTVNGYSPILRTDVMINSMVYNAIECKSINLFAKSVHRPILGMKDLNKCVLKIIENGAFGNKFYNLASFNLTAEEIAYQVAGICKVDVIENDLLNYDSRDLINSKLQTKSYDFSIDTSLFENTYNYKFTENVESITFSLLENWDKMKFVKRTEILKF